VTSHGAAVQSQQPVAGKDAAPLPIVEPEMMLDPVSLEADDDAGINTPYCR